MNLPICSVALRVPLIHAGRRLLQSGLGAILLRATTLLLGILSITLVAPFLGGVQLGQFAVLQAAIAWTSIVALGLPEVCSGILAKFHRQSTRVTAKRYLDSSFTIIGAFAALAWVAMLAVVWLGQAVFGASAPLLWPFVTGIGLALLAAPFALAQASLNADGEISRGTAWALLTAAVSVACIWYVIHFANVPSANRLLVVTLSTGLSTGIVRALMYGVETRRVYGAMLPDSGLSRRRLRSLMSSAYPFVIINIAALASFQIDRFVTYRFLSPLETAQLDVTMKVLVAVYTLFTVLVSKLWHSIGQAWNAGNGLAARALLLQSVSRAALFWVGCGIILLPTLDPVVNALTHGTLRVADRWFVMAAILYMAGRGLVDTVSISIFATRRQRETVTTVIAHGILNIPFSIVGCLALGLPGIMLGQLASLLLTSGLRFPAIFWRVTSERA